MHALLLLLPHARQRAVHSQGLLALKASRWERCKTNTAGLHCMLNATQCNTCMRVLLLLCYARQHAVQAMSSWA